MLSPRLQCAIGSQAFLNRLVQPPGTPLSVFGVLLDVQEVCGDHDYAEPAGSFSRYPPKTVKGTSHNVTLQDDSISIDADLASKKRNHERVEMEMSQQARRTGLREARFQQLHQSRAQTEARIAIFKNAFLGVPLVAKGYENQARQVA